ncbi:MAG: hypothetical protein LUC93_12725 [Planctomycetaceae bacterium]|nr:hypothetical protein [Planctomycetaceae bacterium]
MKILFTYYSLDGNCRALAQLMAGAVGGDLAELRLTGGMPTGFVTKFLVGGKRSLMKEVPVLEPLGVNLDDYGLVVIGGPVWAWNISPAVRSFVSSTDWRGRKTAAFVMHGGGKGKALATIKTLVDERGGEVIATADFMDLRQGDAEQTREKALTWIRATVAGME